MYQPHFLSWGCTLSGNSHASKFRWDWGGAFLPPKFSPYLWLPIPCSNIWLSLPPTLPRLASNSLCIREQTWISDPLRGRACGREVLEKKGQKEVPANSFDELWSYKRCMVCLLSFGAAAGSDRVWRILLGTRLGDAEGAGSAHHLQEWANPSFSLCSPVSCSAQ